MIGAYRRRRPWPTLFSDARKVKDGFMTFRLLSPSPEKKKKDRNAQAAVATYKERERADRGLGLGLTCLTTFFSFLLLLSSVHTTSRMSIVLESCSGRIHCFPYTKVWPAGCLGI